MNRYCILFIVCLSCLVPMPVLAAADTVPASIECGKYKNLSKKEFSGLLKKIQDAYGELSSMQAAFIQYSYLAALDMSEVSKGRVSFQRPGKMRWDYSEPDPQVFLVSDNTFWFYQPEDEQVTIDNFERMVLTDLPLAFLMGLGDVTRDFSVMKACRVKDQIWLELKPRGEKKETAREELKGFSLAVSAKSHVPEGAMVTHVGGNKTTVLFKNSITNKQLANDLFGLEYPPSVDVIDRRSNAG